MPLTFSRASKNDGAAESLNADTLIFSILTGERKILSLIREAETTTSCNCFFLIAVVSAGAFLSVSCALAAKNVLNNDSIVSNFLGCDHLKLRVKIMLCFFKYIVWRAKLIFFSAFALICMVYIIILRDLIYWSILQLSLTYNLIF